MNKLKFICILFSLFLSLNSVADFTPQEEESHYRDMRVAIETSFAGLPEVDSLSDEELKITLDAIEDYYEQGVGQYALDSWIPERLAAARDIRLHIRWWRLLAKHSVQQKLNAEESLLVQRIRQEGVDDPALATELLRASEHFSSPEGIALINETETKFPELTQTYQGLVNGVFGAPGSAEVRAIYFSPTRVSEYEGGNYAAAPKIYMFCRTDRRFPCLMTIKDKFGRALRYQNGALWTQPALALSAYGLAFDRRNGNTPSGVYQVDGVMPSADQTSSFGVFRRLILNFTSVSGGEENARLLLPELSSNSTWWRESTIARDIGRSLLRIHGTGSRNDNRNLPYYTHLSSLGCITQRELAYDGVSYRDQRNLLDSLMIAMDNLPQYSNETVIRAILYVVPIDSESRRVSPSDLARFGIQ
jgi:hypothetical protein